MPTSRSRHTGRYTIPHPYHCLQEDHSNPQDQMPPAVPAPTPRTSNKSSKLKKVHFTTPEVTDAYPFEDKSSTTSSNSSSSEDEGRDGSDTPPQAEEKTASSKSSSKKMAKSGTKDKDQKKEGTRKKDSSKAKHESSGKSKGKGKDKEKGKKKRKSKKLVIYISDSGSESATSIEETAEESGKETDEEDNSPQESQPNPSSSNNYNPFYTGFDEERTLSNQYFYTQVLSKQYPDQLQIRPDNFWSASDCSILATLEARQRALKWHHLQSDFYNATGRMVSIELLQAKLEPVPPNSS